MLSTTGLTQFIANQNRIGAPLHVIVKLTDGTSTWYLSDTEMELTDGHVYALLTGMSGIHSEADPLSKVWSVSDVTLDFVNAPYMDNATGRYQRLSDQIINVVGKDVYIYLAAGIPTAISDCLQRFYGKVSQDDGAIVYSLESVSILCIDKVQAYNKTIPTTLFTDDTDLGYIVSAEVAEQAVPLTYGVFTFDKWNPRSGTGLMKGFPLNDKQVHPVFQFASHALEAITDLFYQSGDQALPWDTDTVDLSAATAVLPDEFVWVFMSAYDMDTGANNSVYGFDQSEQTSSSSGVDGSASTYASIEDWYDNGSERRGTAGIYFDEAAEGVFSRAISSNASRNNTTDVSVIYKLNELVTHNVQRTIYLCHASGPAYALTLSTLTWDNTERTATGTISAATANNKAERYAFQIHAITSAAGADNVVNNQELFRLYRVGVQAKWQFEKALNGEDPPEDVAWATGTGRAYGSYIDAVGRSNSYAAGDPIDTISGVIESLLRDVLVVPDAMIDYASFDEGLESQYYGADPVVQILERKPAFDYIKQLTEQFKMMFCWTANSKARLIPLIAGTTARTIPFSHIVNGQIGVRRTAPFANDITARSRWIEFYNSYMDSDTGEDATSKTNYGTISYQAEWPHISGANVTSLIDHLMGAFGTPGLWAAPHNIIDLETVGFTNADLEVGDWIELEAASCDGQVKLFGETWASRQFMVTSVDQGQYTTRISAIELFEP